MVTCSRQVQMMKSRTPISVMKDSYKEDLVLYNLSKKQRGVDAPGDLSGVRRHDDQEQK